MKHTLKTTATYLLAVLLFLLMFAAGYFTHAYLNPATSKFAILDDVYRLIGEHGYQPMPDPPAMEYGAIRGLVESYGDPHTRFLEPVRAELQGDMLSGSYGGIGAKLARDGDGRVVLHPFPDSPASEAGLLDGDRLLQVDNQPITPETPLANVVAAIRGPEDQPVTLTIARPPDGSQMTFTVKRANIPLPSVTWNIDPVDPLLGMVHVNVIASSTPDEIIKAVADLQERGATRFALDLRGNGGGLLDEGVNIARLFLKDGVIIQRQEKNGDVKTYKVQEAGPLSNIPLVILVDSGTASASEIIAGSIQAHSRAPLVGVPTYGKDTIQSVFSLADHSSLAVTSAKWWVPGLPAPVGEGGLQPDIAVSPENSGDADPYLEAARTCFREENPAP